MGPISNKHRTERGLCHREHDRWKRCYANGAGVSRALASPKREEESPGSIGQDGR